MSNRLLQLGAEQGVLSPSLAWIHDVPRQMDANVLIVCRLGTKCMLQTHEAFLDTDAVRFFFWNSHSEDLYPPTVSVAMTGAAVPRPSRWNRCDAWRTKSTPTTSGTTWISPGRAQRVLTGLPRSPVSPTFPHSYLNQPQHRPAGWYLSWTPCTESGEKGAEISQEIV